MLGDEEKRNDAGPTLRVVEPIAGPRIAGEVRIAAIPDVDAVEGVIEERDPNEEEFEQKNAGQTVEKLNLLGVGDGAFEGFGIGDEMFEKKSSDGDDAAKGMKTPQPERGSLSGAEGSYAGFELRGDGGSGG